MEFCFRNALLYIVASHHSINSTAEAIALTHGIHFKRKKDHNVDHCDDRVDNDDDADDDYDDNDSSDADANVDFVTFFISWRF